MPIAENLGQIKEALPEGVTLVAVSKTKSPEEIMEAYEAGQRIMGENKIQEMTSKYEVLPKEIEWHMIGHVQRNKVKYMASFVKMIHAVDSKRLLEEINKQAEKHDRMIECLLQLKIAKEESKFGLSKDEALEILNSEWLPELRHIRVVGLMGMATFTEDEAQLHQEFQTIQNFFKTYSSQFGLQHLSIGMSGDFPIALDHGSTMVRIGSAIFGARNYN